MDYQAQRTHLFTHLLEEDSLNHGCEIALYREDTAARLDLAWCEVCDRTFHRTALEPCGPADAACPDCRETWIQMQATDPEPFLDLYQDAKAYAERVRTRPNGPQEWTYEECLAYHSLLEGYEIALYHDERRNRIWLEEYATLD